eukprot:c10529_g1_i2.p1 GENE.c10529_g1_i2~~c10529_g1_i2.p1  ORF type:complete len:172 (-),score=45.71 c10529_g1_i2:38-553(-)
MVAALTLATKWTDDVFYTNDHYAEVGGLSLAEMNLLETELTRLLNWDLVVSRDAFSKVSLFTKSTPVEQVLEQVLAVRLLLKATHTFAPLDDDDWEFTVSDRGDDMIIDTGDEVFRGAHDEEEEDDSMFADTSKFHVRQAFGQEYGQTPLAPYTKAVKSKRPPTMKSLEIL